MDNNIFTLYRHWDKHLLISQSIKLNTDQQINQKIFSEMVYLINERMNIWRNKNSGQPRPYTQDPILSQFRFCNVYRELDRQTLAIHQSCNHLRSDFPLWLLNIALSRFICQTDTLNKIGELSFSSLNNQIVEDKLRQLPRPKFGNAYVFPVSILKTINCRDREEFFCRYLPELIPKVAKIIEQFSDESVVDILPVVTKTFGANFKFHWTEILIDVAYQYPERLNLYKKFPIGPGSRPTMIQLFPHNSAEDTCLKLVIQKYDPKNLLEYQGQKILLSAENWEGVGCEFRKYEALVKGLGRKRYYETKTRRI